MHKVNTKKIITIDDKEVTQKNHFKASLDALEDDACLISLTSKRFQTTAPRYENARRPLHVIIRVDTALESSCGAFQIFQTACQFFCKHF